MKSFKEQFVGEDGEPVKHVGGRSNAATYAFKPVKNDGEGEKRLYPSLGTRRRGIDDGDVCGHSRLLQQV